MAKPSVSKDLKALFPGEEYTIETAEGYDDLTVVIYPLGVGHMRRFSAAVEQVLPKIASQVNLSAIADNPKEMMSMVIPILLSDALDLINGCVVGVDLCDPNFPHWELPPILDIWIKESFGTSGKVRPWVEVVENTVEQMTGNRPGIWETVSQSLQSSDLTSTTSSTDSGETAPIPDGPSVRSPS